MSNYTKIWVRSIRPTDKPSAGLTHAQSRFGIATLLPKPTIILKKSHLILTKVTFANIVVVSLVINNVSFANILTVSLVVSKRLNYF